MLIIPASPISAAFGVPARHSCTKSENFSANICQIEGIYIENTCI